MEYDDIVARMHVLRDEMAQIAALETPTAADEARMHTLAAEFDQVDAERLRIERGRILDTYNRGHSIAGVGYAPQGNSSNFDRDPFSDPISGTQVTFRGSDPWDLRSVHHYGRSREAVAGELRSRARSAIERMPGASDRIRSAATDFVDQQDSPDGALSRQVLATSDPAYLRAFVKLAKQPMGTTLDADDRAALARVDEFRAMSLTDSAGGYLIPFALDPTVLIAANGSINQVREIARTVVATGDVWNGVSAAAVAWSWDAEAEVVSDDAPSFAPISIPIFKAAGFVPISIEALGDAGNVAEEVGRLLTFGKDVLEASAFAIGVGAGQPQGVIIGLQGTASVIPSGSADTLAVSDIYNLHGQLPTRYSVNASWLSHKLTYNRIRQFDVSGGGSLWAQLGDDRPPLLLGRPVYEAEDFDGSITATEDNNLMVFGDFSNYIVADRIGTTVELIPHLFQPSGEGHDTASRPTGQRGWYAWYRTGAKVANPGAFRMLNVT